MGAAQDAAVAADTGSTVTQEVRLVALRWEADGIASLELRPLQGGLAAFEPGAHIELLLPGGLRRAYSLTNAPGQREAYRVAVQRDPASRGGSRAVHEALRIGQTLTIGRPRNLFALADDAAPSVLIAGGIGITPVWAMAQQLAAQQRAWTLHYAVRERRRAAFVEPLLALDAARVHLHVDGESGAFDLAACVAAAPAEAHLYCCGPGPMLEAFERACAGRDPSRVHLERFGSAADTPAAAAGGFEVVLARAGKTLPVPPGTSILDAVLAAGVDAPNSCREGYCGTCETRVLEGTPLHADSVLSTAERAANRTMMICRSRCLGERLVLDL